MMQKKEITKFVEKGNEVELRRSTVCVQCVVEKKTLFLCRNVYDLVMEEQFTIYSSRHGLVASFVKK